jgi:hypothetical protein
VVVRVVRHVEIRLMFTDVLAYALLVGYRFEVDAV